MYFELIDTDTWQWMYRLKKGLNIWSLLNCAHYYWN